MASVLLLKRDCVLMTLLLMLLLIRSGSAHNECDENLSCGPGEPLIRFPFQLVKEMEEPCTYPRLCFSCTEKTQTMLLLPTIKLQVVYINYQFQEIFFSDPENCFSNKFMQIINFVQSYQFESPPFDEPHGNLSFFNCTSARHRQPENRYSPIWGDSYSQDTVSCPIFISNPYDSVLEMDITSCTKMFHIPSPIRFPESKYLRLIWPKPNCSECEEKGKRCKWKSNNNDTEGDIECFECTRKIIHVPKSLIFAISGQIRDSCTFAF